MNIFHWELCDRLINYIRVLQPGRVSGTEPAGHGYRLKSPGSIRVPGEKKNTGSGARYDLKPGPKSAISDISIFQSIFTILD